MTYVVVLFDQWDDHQIEAVYGPFADLAEAQAFSRERWPWPGPEYRRFSHVRLVFPLLSPRSHVVAIDAARLAVERAMMSVPYDTGPVIADLNIAMDCLDRAHDRAHADDPLSETSR